MRYVLYVLLFLLVAGALAFGVGFYYIYSKVRFDAYQLIDYNPNLTTQIYDRNGVLLANLFKKEHRIYVKYEDIPARVIEALVAIEDTAFFEHPGVNVEAITRAIIKAVKAGKLTEGASTLTQQLVKNEILTSQKTLIRKINEAVISLKLETLLTKEEILERYLNEVYFGHGYYGIKTAAQGYFRKNLDELNLKEISMLVGAPRSPNFYNPTRNYEFSLSRANIVLNRMHTLGWINDNEYLKSQNIRPTVYNDTLTKNIAPYIVDEVLKRGRKEFEDIQYGGYQIHLTLDYELQKLGTEAINFGYRRLVNEKKLRGKSLNGAMVVLKQNTGEILALIGGKNYKQSNFNRATQTSRQPGSSFKPFLYQIALNNGYNPDSEIADISRVYKYGSKIWAPKNYGSNFKGMVTLKNALVHSRNLATINLVNSVGMDKVYDDVKKFGFEDIQRNLSFSLGSFGISPMKLSELYTIVSNYGVKVKPRLISTIENRFGETKIIRSEKNAFVYPEQSYLLIDIMREVVNRGTGRSVKTANWELAGKTGTTNNNVDAWFCGFSPEIQTIVWFGRDNNKPLGYKATGGAVSAPVFKYFMDRYLEKNPHTTREFKVPQGVHSIVINGKKKLFTDISKLPIKRESTSVDINEELLF